jgi:hypothetical protein
LRLEAHFDWSDRSGRLNQGDSGVEHEMQWRVQYLWLWLL